VLLSGKFGAVIAAIPLPIIAAVYCVLFAYVGMYDSLVIDNNSDFYVGL
jgi:xanthine/uracil permease